MKRTCGPASPVLGASTQQPGRIRHEKQLFTHCSNRIIPFGGIRSSRGGAGQRAQCAASVQHRHGRGSADLSTDQEKIAPGPTRRLLRGNGYAEDIQRLPAEAARRVSSLTVPRCLRYGSVLAGHGVQAGVDPAHSTALVCEHRHQRDQSFAAATALFGGVSSARELSPRKSIGSFTSIALLDGLTDHRGLARFAKRRQRSMKAEPRGHRVINAPRATRSAAPPDKSPARRRTAPTAPA